jgi:hypothetical protein
MTRLIGIVIVLSLAAANGCKEKNQRENESASDHAGSHEVAGTLLGTHPDWQIVRDSLDSMDPASAEYKDLADTVRAIEAMASPTASEQEWANSLKMLGPSIGLVVELQLANLEYFHVKQGGNPWQIDAAGAKFRERLDAARNRWRGQTITTNVGIHAIRRDEVVVNADLSIASLMSAYRISCFIGAPRAADQEGLQAASRDAEDVAGTVMVQRAITAGAAGVAANNILANMIERRTGIPLNSVVAGGTVSLMAMNPTFVVGWVRVPDDLPVADATRLRIGGTLQLTFVIEDILGDDPLRGHTVVARWENSRRSLSPSSLVEAKVEREQKVFDGRLNRGSQLVKSIRIPQPRPDSYHADAVRGVVVNPDLSDVRRDLKFDVEQLESQLQINTMGLRHRKSSDSKEMAYVAGLLSQRDSSGWTPLHYAAAHGNAEAVAYLTSEYCHPLTHSGALVGAFDLDSSFSDSMMLTPLHLAAWNGDPSTVQALVTAITRVTTVTAHEEPSYNPGDPRFNPAVQPGQIRLSTTTPLWKFIESRSPYVFARPDIVYQYISPEPIHRPRAVWESLMSLHPGLASFSKQNSGLFAPNNNVAMYPPDINEPDAHGLTALDYAVIMGHEEAARLFRANGAVGKTP